MSEQFKFPNGGYEVTVLRKQDILDCIDDNIIDKELNSRFEELKDCKFIFFNSLKKSFIELAKNNI